MSASAEKEQRRALRRLVGNEASQVVKSHADTILDLQSRYTSLAHQFAADSQKLHTMDAQLAEADAVMARYAANIDAEVGETKADLAASRRAFTVFCSMSFWQRLRWLVSGQ